MDQSGKIGDTKVSTALAFSNGKRHAILIPATVKRECVRVLRGERKLETKRSLRLFLVDSPFEYGGTLRSHRPDALTGGQWAGS